MSEIFPAKSSKLASRNVAGEMVILNAEDSSLYVLNELGTRIWDAVDGRTPARAIVDAICREYDMDRDTVQRDVVEFIEALVKHGVLLTSDHPATVGGTGAISEGTILS
jgi:Coenzyme PQQ synthesis protein D (PqqD)